MHDQYWGIETHCLRCNAKIFFTLIFHIDLSLSHSLSLSLSLTLSLSLPLLVTYDWALNFHIFNKSNKQFMLAVTFGSELF